MPNTAYMNTANRVSAQPADAKAQGSGGHRERLRERFLRAPTALEDYEVLELLLFYGVPRKDTKPLAKALLRQFGTLRAALEASPEALLAVPGFGPGLAAFWQVLREVRARMATQEVRDAVLLNNPSLVARMARERLAGCRHEECWLALVNAQNCLLDWLPVQHGNVHDVHIDPGEILRTALARKASGIILVHNHPGGKARPSAADRAMTDELRLLAPRLGLRFLDHVIVGDEECFSMETNTTV